MLKQLFKASKKFSIEYIYEDDKRIGCYIKLMFKDGVK